MQRHRLAPREQEEQRQQGRRGAGEWGAAHRGRKIDEDCGPLNGDYDPIAVGGLPTGE
jgi:hypothetical protein